MYNIVLSFFGNILDVLPNGLIGFVSLSMKTKRFIMTPKRPSFIDLWKIEHNFLKNGTCITSPGTSLTQLQIKPCQVVSIDNKNVLVQ